MVRCLTVVALAAAGALVLPQSALAAVDGGDGGGSVTVGASTSGVTNGDPGGSTSDTSDGAQGSPWMCAYTALLLNDGPGFAPGGPGPGGWYSVTCTDRSTGATATDTEWIPDGTSTVTPPVDPYAVARQAEDSLRLPSPITNFNPSAFSVVNLATWLWIDPHIWHSYAVTASVGSVSATAVATPSSVTWSMGDGGVVTCAGPGTPFDPARSATQQSNPCVHTYTISSAGQPSADGNPNDGAFVVVATIDWSVSWTATGAAGGGTLPPLSTSSSSPVRVEQVESINSEPSDGSDGNSAIGGRST